VKIHIVQKGDTLWNLSKKYGVDFEQLKSVNSHLSNPDMIMPGMKIKIPTGSIPVKKEAQKSKEAPVKKEAPVQKPAPQPKLPEMPKMPQMTHIQPTQQEVEMNFNFYKPQTKEKPAPVYPSKQKAEVAPPPPPKKQPVEEVKAPAKEAPKMEMPKMEMPKMPVPPAFPIQQQVKPYAPQAAYPITPPMPGCAPQYPMTGAYQMPMSPSQANVKAGCGCGGTNTYAYPTQGAVTQGNYAPQGYSQSPHYGMAGYPQPTAYPSYGFPSHQQPGSQMPMGMQPYGAAPTSQMPGAAGMQAYGMPVSQMPASTGVPPHGAPGSMQAHNAMQQYGVPSYPAPGTFPTTNTWNQPVTGRNHFLDEDTEYED